MFAHAIKWIPGAHCSRPACRQAGDASRKGLSLIEILIFVLLVSILLVGLSYGTIFSLRNSKFAQDKTRATRLAQELQDWLRGQRDVDWEAFVGGFSLGTYCVNSIPSDIGGLVAVTGSCPSYSLQSRFKREMTVTNIAANGNSMTYEISVYWRDAGTVHKAQIATVLALPE